MSNYSPIPSPPQELVVSDYSPITPPQELVDQWVKEWHHSKISNTVDLDNHLTTQAAQWGADQELEASLAWLVQEAYIDAPCRLRAARRPKPLSLKERIAAAITDGDERTALSLLNEALPHD